MAQWSWVRGVFVAAATVIASASAAIPAQSATSLWMQTGSVTSQPIGHYEFCQKYKAECQVKAKSSVPPRVTEFGWATIREINSSVNHAITPMTDEDLFGREEVWTYPDKAGDCEDYVLLKRKKLLDEGFSSADVL